MSILVFTSGIVHIYGWLQIELQTSAEALAQWPGAMFGTAEPGLRREADLNYCPALATAVVITSGRLSSRVSSVPAGRVAERCLLSQ